MGRKISCFHFEIFFVYGMRDVFILNIDWITALDEPTVIT